MTDIFTDVEVLHGIPQADYFTMPEVSRSDLVKCLTDPARYQRWKKEHKTTPEMELGTMIHELVLEGIEPMRGATVALSMDCLTKKGLLSKTPKTSDHWKHEVAQAEDAGLDIYLDTEADAIREKVYAIAAVCRREFGGILDGGHPEVVILAAHVRTGLRIKARLDIMGKTGSAGVTDLKTARDASRAGITKEVGTRRLDIQAALYSDLAAAACGMPTVPFRFACVEKEGDYLTGLWDLPDTWIGYGREGYEQAIDRWMHYQDHPWPTSHGRGTLEPRAWDVR
jgi:hypothetical protein